MIHGLGLHDRLSAEFEPLAKRCFDWVCRRLQVPAPDRHSRLIHTKHAAYAWRQMVFFLAMWSEGEDANLELWARERLLKVPVGPRERLIELTGGLELRDQLRRHHGKGKVFLGWTVGPCGLPRPKGEGA